MQICDSQHCEAAMVLLVCHPLGIFQHLLCGRGALQPAGVAHTVFR